MTPYEELAKVLPPSVADRFAAKISVSDSGCWEWTAYRGPQGYGRFSIDRKSKKWYTHRFTYEHLIGHVPDGLVLDHFVCDNTACCNPRHVRPVTPRENTLRAIAVGSFNPRKGEHNPKPFCINGHPRTPENLYYVRGGAARGCRICSRAAKAAYKRRKREAANLQ